MSFSSSPFLFYLSSQEDNIVDAAPPLGIPYFQSPQTSIASFPFLQLLLHTERILYNFL